VLYSFSFAPNPNWSRLYPLQQEIRDYLQNVARDFAVLHSIRFNTAVTGAQWDEDELCWRVQTERGALTAGVLIGGDPDRRLTPIERLLFRHVPLTQRAVRDVAYLLHEASVLGTVVDRRLSAGAEAIGRRHLRSQVRDPELRAKLTPHYTLGCKRITLSNTYYRALTQDNAEVVTEPIAQVRERSIVTADGTERELDAIVLATGFSVFDHPGMAAVRGRGGVAITDAWRGSPRAYLGTTVAGFPNLFMLVGPNSAGGYNSIVFTTEAHVQYAVQAIKTMDREGLRSVEVRRGVYDEFNRRTERALRGSVWNSGGCSSWYLDRNGRNGVWWPGFTWRLWQRTRRFELADYVAR
jgi:cation diffusion facilitator CzcD-associated flavoprotein CzcO